MDNQYLLGIFLVMGVATFMTRLLPFVALTQSQSHPLLVRVGRSLPPMIMVILVCFGLSSLQIESLDRLGLSFIALSAVTTLQLSIGNPLLSILVGTGMYTLGVQWFGIA